MSPGNEERLRRALDAVNRRDRASWVALCDPQIENVPPRAWPESERTVGPDAIWNFYAEGAEPWEKATYEYFEIIEATDDTIVAQMGAELRGKASGAPVTWSFWQLVVFRNGRATRVEWFVDRAEALRAAALVE